MGWDIKIDDQLFDDGKTHTYIVMKKKQSVQPFEWYFPDWTEMIGDEVIGQVMQARNWLQKDITVKH